MSARVRPTQMVQNYILRSAAASAAAVVLMLGGVAARGLQAGSAVESLTNQQIVQRIDAAVEMRANAISSYTVQEQYSLYRNGDPAPSAQETVQTTYNRATGKRYTTVAQSGSSFLRSTIIDKVLAGEKEANLPENRESSWLTSKNYEMQPKPGRVEKNGRKAIVIDLKPRRKSSHLFNGKIWVDASDFTVIHLEGSPGESPSIFVGLPTVARDYQPTDGFSMATHAEAHSHSSLFGDTVLKIDYTNYKIERVTASAGDTDKATAR